MTLDLKQRWRRFTNRWASSFSRPSCTEIALAAGLLLHVSTVFVKDVLGEDGRAGEVKHQQRSDSSIAWRFDHPHQLDGEPIGQATIAATGPTAPLYMDMPAENKALELQSAGSYWRVPDSADETRFDFNNGDPITLEAWVRVDSLAKSNFAYIVGKGRTYEQAPSENHNYAMRLVGSGGSAKLSFLFSTENEDGDFTYHRWTSRSSFGLDGAWHHVAVSYQFGEPESIQGYVDGRITAGVWDMGGPTTAPPVVDNDAVWIGSSRGGAAGNSLIGAVDDVRIHHRIVEEAELINRRVLVPYTPAWPTTALDSEVTVALYEDIRSHAEFPPLLPAETFRFTLPKLALHRLPLKVSSGGVRESWDGPVLLQAFSKVALPAGEHEVLLRSPGRSRLWVNGRVVVETPPRKLFPDAHQPFVVYEPDLPWLRVPYVGDREVRGQFSAPGDTLNIVLETLVGAADARCELGETLVAVRRGQAMFRLLGPPEESSSSTGETAEMNPTVHLVDQEFLAYRDAVEAQLERLDRQLLETEAAKEAAFWERRHEMARNAVQHTWPEWKQPQLSPNQTVDYLIERQLSVEELEQLPRLAPPISDLDFLRRASLDALGIPPSLKEAYQYLQPASEFRRRQTLERLVHDDRWADHWTSYWQDVLAENPSILKPSLNNTGPFRLWIHDAIVLNKPMDRFATELIRMEGGKYAGAAAGFEMATQNDVPMAEKAHVVASAFLGLDMKCARCHDAPYHPWKQRDLFQIGAMLGRKSIEVPETSSVPAEFFERKGDDSPVRVTLQPGENVPPEWPATILSDEEFGPQNVPKDLMRSPNDLREQLAAMITRGENRRFAQVMVNRLWTRLMGWGLIDSTDDWHEAEIRHPDLLEFLSREFVLSGYDFQKIALLIMNSEVYQRQSIDDTQVRGRLAYAAPWQRRMSAEQVVDSMHSVTGVSLATEPVTMDPEASQKIQNFLNLGVAQRAWQLASLSNERDRPSLLLPKASAVVECLEAFGWRPTRQSPLTHRASEANVVQPSVLANSAVTTWVTRLTNDSAITKLALNAKTVESFVDDLFLSLLTRLPTDTEKALFLEQLTPEFRDRIQEQRGSIQEPPPSRGFVTWSNHFAVGANQLKRELEREMEAGPQAADQLLPAWRERTKTLSGPFSIRLSSWLCLKTLV